MSTPSQTVGPFFDFALPYEGGERLVAPGDADAIRIVGAVIDGDGSPVDDALVEIWQANRHGRYRHPEDTREELPLEDGFAGGRCPTDAEGRFSSSPSNPAPPTARRRTSASASSPAGSCAISTRGSTSPTRRRRTPPTRCSRRSETTRCDQGLIARPHDGVLSFDIHLQGERQTAFLDV